ncbi:MAG: DUF1080 domain-containing protein [bacterium]
MILQRLFLLSLILISFLFSSPQNRDWVSLFNGKNLDGWQLLNGTAKYTVENGEIVGTSKMKTPNSFLVTKEVYTNFILEYDIKMDEGLNSGVQIRSKSIESYQNGRVHGLQIECEDSKRSWAGGIYDEARKGWRYPLEYNPKAKSAYNMEKWNKFKVAAIGNRIIVWVNGIPTANLLEEEVETGFFGLQVHDIGNDTALEGKQIRWRNIRMKPATATDLKTIGKIDAPEVSYLSNELTDREKSDGWKLLWDGKTTNGWRGAKLTKFPDQGWLINEGVLQVQPSDGSESINGGDLVTEKKYRNFILEVDFSITKGANSGIKYFVDTELNKGQGSSIGCEFQILDDEIHPDAKLGVNGNRTMGSLYDLIRANGKEYNPYLPREKYVNGYNQWNRASIVVRGSLVQHHLNGLKVVEYDRSTQLWRVLVACSKYKDWPHFGEQEVGNILLQDHGNEVKFQNIKIKELQ